MNFNAYSEQKEIISSITLVSCGHIFAKKGREIYRPHGREDWLLFYIAKGYETFYFDKYEIADAGSFVIFSPNEPQCHKTELDKSAEFYYIHFKCATLPDNLSLETSHVYKTTPSRKICDIFEEVINNTLEKQPCYEQLNIYKLLEIITLLKREIIQDMHPQKINFERIGRAVSHINKYYYENLNLEEYAKLCNMSKHHFARVFKEITGNTPIEYRNSIRLEHAAEMLIDMTHSVEEISTITGYTSASYFSNAFKHKYHLSPKQFQQKYNK